MPSARDLDAGAADAGDTADSIAAVGSTALAEAVSALHAHGHAVVQGLFSPALLARLAEAAQSAVAADRLRAAGVGATGRREPALRGDSIAWLDPGAGPAEAGFLDACEQLRRGLNRGLLLGLAEFEAHFALYPPGAGYARHRDCLRDDDARVLSLACYLNAGWSAADGGALRLHLPGRTLEVLPRIGTCVLFLSADTEHEVLPAQRARHSIAGWFRQRRLQDA